MVSVVSVPLRVEPHEEMIMDKNRRSVAWQKPPLLIIFLRRITGQIPATLHIPEETRARSATAVANIVQIQATDYLVNFFTCPCS